MTTDTQTLSTQKQLSDAQEKRWGKYRARVEDNNDPKKLGRLRVSVPSVFGKEHVTGWIFGAFPFGGSSKEAMMFIPANKSQVLVEFIEGSEQSPVWTATYVHRDAASNADLAPPPAFDMEQGALHLIRTEGGIEIRLEDNRKEGDEGARQVVISHPKGCEIRIDAKGVVTISDSGGASLLLDPDNKITRLKGHGDGSLEMKDDATTLAHGSGAGIKLESSGVTVTGGSIALDGDAVSLGKNAAAPVMNAQAFVTEFIAHVHPCPTGSTTPPAPPNPALLQAVSLAKVTGA